MRARSVRRRWAVLPLEYRLAPAVFTVGDLGDAGVGSGLVGDLRYCLTEANAMPGDDTIIFDPALFGSGAQTIALNTAIDVTDNVAIQGPGAGLLTITNATKADRHLRITGTGTLTVSIAKLTFRDGQRVGNLTTDRGGSIFIENENVTISDSAFTANATTASRGGALALQSGGSLVVANTSFGDNSASLSGGAVFIGAGSVSFTNAAFTQNKFTGTATAGGAIEVTGSATVAIAQSDFTGNSAGTSTGGAMAISGTAAVTVSDTKFTGNTAANGGAIRVSGGSLSVSDSTISGNTTTGRGGGVYVTGNSTVTVQRSTVADNIITGTVGGGGISILGGTLTLVDSTVSGNKAGSRGGGLYVGSATALIDRTTFSNNIAPTFGGGVSFTSSATAVPSVLRNSTLTGNTAAQGGGVSTYIMNGLVFIQNSTIVGNTATSVTANQGGGGIVRHGSGAGSTFVESTIVAGNTATTAGPDVLGAVTAINSLIQNDSGTTFNPDSTGNLTLVDPQLGPLTKLPGTLTAVFVPADSSPVVNAGSNPATGRAFDQRGVTRSFGRTDIGSVELVTANVPTAAADLTDIAGDGLTEYQFTVRLTDNDAFDTTTLGDNDFRVTGPNGFDQLAKLVSISGPSGPLVGATYKITAPAAAFTQANLGTYTIAVEPNSLADTAGAFVPAGPLGQFRIDVTSLVVTNTDDAGPGSLRQTLADANQVRTPNVITFAPALFAAGAQTITLTSDVLSIATDTTLTGPGADMLTIDGNGALRILQIDNPTRFTVSVSGLTLANAKRVGTATADRGAAARVGDETVTFTGVRFLNSQSNRGGAVAVEGAATVLFDRCFFDGNISPGTGFTGGALNLVGGSVTTVRDSTFQFNTANGFGGAIYVENSTLTVEGSTFFKNSVTGTVSNGKGGAIQINYTGTATALPVTIRNSTFSENKANVSGGAINTGQYKGNLSILNTTVTQNTAPSGGGLFIALNAGGGTVTLDGTIVAGNTAATAGPDIATGAFTVNAASSVIGDGDGAIINQTGGNQIGSGVGGNVIDAKLAPLGDYGGPTPTHALLPGSPAIDFGSNTANLKTDQRGKLRVSGAGADAGAFELNAPTVKSLVIDDGGSQRSMVTKLVVTFDQIVTFPIGVAAAFALQHTGPGTPGAVTLAANESNTGVETVVTLTFSGPFTEGAASLIDGNYTLTIDAAGVANQNNGFDGNGDGTPADAYTSSFHRLFGDADGSRTVNFTDFLAFRTAFGTVAGDPNYSAAFDLDGSNSVNFNDFLAFRARFGTTLAP